MCPASRTASFAIWPTFKATICLCFWVWLSIVCKWRGAVRKRGFPRIQFAPCPQLMCLLVPFQVDLTAHTDSAGGRVLCLLQNQTEQHAGGILQQAVEHEPAMYCGRCRLRAGAVSGRGRCRHVLGAGCLILCDITPRGLLQYRCDRDGGHGNVPLRNGVKGMAVTMPNEISCGMILISCVKLRCIAYCDNLIWKINSPSLAVRMVEKKSCQKTKMGCFKNLIPHTFFILHLLYAIFW